MILIVPLAIIAYLALGALGLRLMSLADSTARPGDFFWRGDEATLWCIAIGPVTFIFGLIAFKEYRSRLVKS